MGGKNGGTNNNSINRRSVSWQKNKRIKARVVKKRVGTKERHVATAIKGVSGIRSKKSQRKVERRKRLDAKDEAALEAAMEVDPVLSKKLKKKSTSQKKEIATEDAAPMQQ